ncbi:MAG: hypothetical protein ACE5IY_02480 [bacterium]
MSLLRLILIAILFYWGIKLFRGILRLFGSEREQVDGKPKGKGPLDLSQHDVEDADFEEIE